MTPSPPKIDDFHIPDGFVYSAGIRPALPYDWRGLALQRMRALRLSTHRPYIHCTRNFTMAPFTNVQTQIRMLAQTYLWGYWFNVQPMDSSSTVSPHNLYAKITDNATGAGPYADWISDQDLFAMESTALSGIGYIAYPQILPEPYVVTEPGMMTVELCNNGTNLETAIVQMQLIASVPCDRPQNSVDLGACI